MKNLEPQQQEWQKSKKEEIREISDFDFKAILEAIYTLVGLRVQNFPESREEGFIISFMRRNFGYYTPNLVLNAFEAAICGKLEVKDPNCYENFSCEYVARILTAYKQHLILSGKLKSSFELERQYIPPSNQLTNSKMTDDEVIEMYKDVWDSTGNVVYMSDSAYDILCRNLQINLTKEEKLLLIEEVKPIVKKIFGENEPQKSAERNKEFAKKLAVAKYFESLNMKEEDAKIKKLDSLWMAHKMLSEKIALAVKMPNTENYKNYTNKINDWEKELEELNIKIKNLSSK